MEKELYEEGLERYPIGYVIGRILFFYVYFGIGALGVGFFTSL